MTVPTAHTGHWLASAAYALPVLVLAGWVAVAKLRQARRRRRDAGSGAAGSERPRAGFD